jgi:hypothetical protein
MNITILPHMEITIDRCWGGLVGYDDCLTRSRSRVRFPSRVTFCFSRQYELFSCRLVQSMSLLSSGRALSIPTLN